MISLDLCKGKFSQEIVCSERQSGKGKTCSEGRPGKQRDHAEGQPQKQLDYVESGRYIYREIIKQRDCAENRPINCLQCPEVKHKKLLKERVSFN